MSQQELIDEGMRDLARLGAYVLEHWIEGSYDLDGGELFDMVRDAGLIEEVPGGFNSEKHEAGAHDPEEGDPWYETTKPVQLARRWIEQENARAKRGRPQSGKTTQERADG